MTNSPRWLPYTGRCRPDRGDRVRQHRRRGFYHDYVGGVVIGDEGPPGLVAVRFVDGIACSVRVSSLRVLRYPLRRDYRTWTYSADEGKR